MILSFCISPNVKHLSFKDLVYVFDRKHRFYKKKNPKDFSFKTRESGSKR